MNETSLLIVLYVSAIWIFCTATKKLPILSSEAVHRVSSLDGLRGILATAVIVHHFTISYYWHTTSIWQMTDSRVINNMGAVPVSLFFMITGYLFTGKIYRDTPKWSSILSSRVRRIFPMYLLTVSIIIAISFYQTRGAVLPIDETLRAIGSWAIFIGAPINGFQDSLLINAAVHWTLLYETIFYLSLPLLYCLLRGRMPGISCGFAALALIALWPKYNIYFNSQYVILFIVGITAALLEDRLKRVSVNYSSAPCTMIAIAVLVACMVMQPYSKLQMIALGAPFILFVLGNSLNGLLENRGLKILGEASFSIYLLHGIVIYCFFSLFSTYDFSKGNFIQYSWYLPIIILLVSGVGVMTYWCIERPFLRRRKQTAEPLKQAE